MNIAAETGDNCEQSRSLVRKSVNVMILLALAALALTAITATFAGTAWAATPVILNQSSTGGQTNWLENFTVADNSGNNGNRIWLTLSIKHDPGRSVAGIRIDDDYNGSDSSSTATLRSVSNQRPNVQGGFNHTRVSYNYQVPTSNTGLDCPFVGSGTGTSSVPLRVRAELDNGEQTAASVSTLRFVRHDCNARDDMPYIYQRSQSTTATITPGTSVTFQVTGDDTDSGLTTNRDFGGINWRARRLSDGATTGHNLVCWGNSDNTQRSFSATFPNRGRWVVEAQLRNSNDNCGANPNSAAYFYIGAVDVNTAAGTSPTVGLNATRPQINGNTTVTAIFGDGTDNSQGGRVQAIEWDLDQNTGTGVGGFEAVNLGDITGLSSPQNRVINTAGMTPGLKTVRVRVTDNGAMTGADNARRQVTATTQFLVDTPPVALPDEHRTISGDALPLVLAGTDVDDDTLSYSIVSQPPNGTVTGSGANRVYTPDPGFAGTDSFEFQVDDGYGGTDTAEVEVRVDPDLRPFDGPDGTLDSRAGEIEFGSSAGGATFECQLDEEAWQPCVSPFQVTDLPDGEHTLRSRVTAAGLTNPDVEEATWTVDAYPKVTLDSGPPPRTDQTGAAFDFHLTEDGATTIPTAECQLDELAWIPCVSTVAYEDLDDGEHTLRVRGTDAFGKQSVSQVTWTVLTDGGSTAIEAPLPASYTRQTNAQVNFSASGPSDHTECSLDGDTWQACTSPVELTGLSEGGHSFRVRSVNELGNPSPQPAQVSWTVDRTNPVATITAGPQGPTPNGPAAFTFESNENFSTFECKLDAGDYAACSSPFHLPDGLADGYHSFRVAAIDRAGNRSLAPQRDFQLLSSAPAVEFISGPAQGELTRAPAASFGFTAAAAVPAFECSLDGGDYAPCESPAAFTGLTDGAHSISVRAIDAVGNRSTEAATRDWIVDTTAPATVITNGPAGNSDSPDATFGFTASETGSTFECSLDGAPFTACSSPLELSGLSDGEHQLRVRATDPAGNADSTPASRTWAIDTSDPGPPDPPLTDPETLPCDFSLQQERCGDPYLTGSARAAFRKPRGEGRIDVEVNSGGAALKRIVAKMPAGLGTKAFRGKAGRKIGKVVLTGTSRRSIGLKLPRKVKSTNVVASRNNGLKVTLKPRSVVINGLPEGVTGAKIRLKSSRGLGISARVCGTRTWRASLTDVGSTTRQVNAKGDTNCVRKGNR